MKEPTAGYLIWLAPKTWWIEVSREGTTLINETNAPIFAKGESVFRVDGTQKENISLPTCMANGQPRAHADDDAPNGVDEVLRLTKSVDGAPIETRSISARDIFGESLAHDEPLHNHANAYTASVHFSGLIGPNLLVEATAKVDSCEAHMRSRKRVAVLEPDTLARAEFLTPGERNDVFRRGRHDALTHLASDIGDTCGGHPLPTPLVAQVSLAYFVSWHLDHGMPKTTWLFVSDPVDQRSVDVDLSATEACRSALVQLPVIPRKLENFAVEPPPAVAHFLEEHGRTDAPISFTVLTNDAARAAARALFGAPASMPL